MADPAFNIEAFIAQDREAAQLLAEVLEWERCKENSAEDPRNGLREMQERNRDVREQRHGGRERGVRVTRDRQRLHWLDEPPQREENFANDVELAYSQLEQICDRILAELNREEEVEEGDRGNGPRPDAAYVGPDRQQSHASEDHRHEIQDIRPTGRATRRRVPYTISSQLRQNNFFEASLNFHERDFRVVYRQVLSCSTNQTTAYHETSRVSKRTFWAIVELIQPNEVFVSRGRRRQRPVYHQLAAFLIKYGSMGSRSTFTSLLTSVGDGTVPIYVKRVTHALRFLGLTSVGWPTAERKREIKAAFQDMCGLDGIVGVLDGTLIDLEKRPEGSEESFRSRKGTIATNVQAIVDHEGRFTAYETGFPGSKNDTYIWKRSFIYVHRHGHFDDGEFLLADGGYPLSPYVLVPFARNERQGADRARKILFNRQISKARSLIERTFGKLKLRFPSLVMMGDVRNQDTLFHAIEALMVLHNVCYDLHDTVSGEPDGFVQAGEETYDAVDQEPADNDWGPGADINEDVLEAGRTFRNRCMDLICPE